MKDRVCTQMTRPSTSSCAFSLNLISEQGCARSSVHRAHFIYSPCYCSSQAEAATAVDRLMPSGVAINVYARKAVQEPKTPPCKSPEVKSPAMVETPLVKRRLFESPTTCDTSADASSAGDQYSQ